VAHEEAVAACNRGDPQKAFSHWEAALRWAARAGDDLDQIAERQVVVHYQGRTPSPSRQRPMSAGSQAIQLADFRRRLWAVTQWRCGMLRCQLRELWRFLPSTSASKAFDRHQQALREAKQAHNIPLIALTYEKLGNLQLSQREWKSGLFFFDSAKQMWDLLQDKLGEARTLGKMGEAYRWLGDYKKGKRQHEGALAIRNKLAAHAGEAVSLGHLSTCLEKLGDMGQALEVRNASLEECRHAALLEERRHTAETSSDVWSERRCGTL